MLEESHFYETAYSTVNTNVQTRVRSETLDSSNDQISNGCTVTDP